MIFYDNEPHNQGYMNLGDVDFFEHGRLVREDSIPGGYFVLYCEPDSEQEDNYLFGRCYIDVTDSWLAERVPRMQDESNEEYAVRCIDELGAYEFGYDFPYPVSWYSRGEVLGDLHDMCVLPSTEEFGKLRSEEPEEFSKVKTALEKFLEAGFMFTEAIAASEESRNGICDETRAALSSLIGKDYSGEEISNTDCYNAAMNTWLHAPNPLTYSGAADCLFVLSDLLSDVISPDDREALEDEAELFTRMQKKADNLSALSA